MPESTRSGGIVSFKFKHSRRRAVQNALAMTSIACWPGILQSQTRLLGIRLVQQENQRVYLELDSLPVDTRIFKLENPKRLVIDLTDSALNPGQQAASFPTGAVSRVRFGVQAGRHLRIVLDLREEVAPSYEFIQRPEGQRLVVNLGVAGNPVVASGGEVLESRPIQVTEAKARQLIVAIDAGHGGKDPGALGRKQTQEKDVTLDIARRLYKRLQGEEGVTPVLIREKDEYIGLRRRVEIAREQEADLFVSIHADAVPRKEAKGSSVYALSLKGASSETAQWLADNEKQADLFGDVTLDGLSRDLQQTLIELAQNSTLESSIELAAHMLSQLHTIGPLHKETVELANFAVLKSPDIPSVLVETAFISNPGEERKLNSKRFRDKVAQSLHTGIMNYLRLRAPIGTLLAEQRKSVSG